MDKTGLTLIGLGLGVLIGATLSKTKWGEEINEEISKAFAKLKDDVLPVLNELEILEKKSNELMEV